MYVWIGCKLPEDFERKIRNHCLALNETIGLSTFPFSLPQHISLKISFDAGEQYEQILSWLEKVLEKENMFYVNLLPVEQQETILWIPVAENPRLQALHQMLDKELEERFQVPQHPFDQAFFFHSTLFMDTDREKLAKMALALADLSFPSPVPINQFLIGLSPDGKTDIRIVREINIS